MSDKSDEVRRYRFDRRDSYHEESSFDGLEYFVKSAAYDALKAERDHLRQLLSEARDAFNFIGNNVGDSKNKFTSDIRQLADKFYEKLNKALGE